MSRTDADACAEACQTVGRELRALYGALPWSCCCGHAHAVWAACREPRLDWVDAEPLIHAAWAREPVARSRPAIPSGTVFAHTVEALLRVQDSADVSRALLSRAPFVLAGTFRTGRGDRD